MIRKSALLALVCLSGGVLSLPAALPPPPGSGSTSTTPARTPTRGAAFKDPTVNSTGVDDKVLATYLSGAQRTTFEADVKKMDDAHDALESAERDANVTETKGSLIKTGADQVRKNAQEKITDSRKTLMAIAPELQGLRKTALENMGKYKDQAKATSSAVYAVATGQLPDVLQPMANKTISSLAEDGYKHIYLAGAYAFEDKKYTEKPDLTEQLRQALTQADKVSKLFTAKTPWKFKIGVEGGKQVVSFPDRSADKSALVLGEVIYDPDSGYAAFSVRGVDLSNMRVVSNQLAMLSVEPALGKMLDLSALKVPSKRIPATGADKAATPALSVTVQDTNNQIGRTKEAQRLTRIVNAGDNASPNNRFTALVLKSFLNDQLDVPVTDYDVLTMALGPDQPAPAEINTVWVLPDTAALDQPSIDLLLRVGNNNVGKFSIQRNLPKLSGPSAADLRAGGYALGGARTSAPGNTTAK